MSRPSTSLPLPVPHFEQELSYSCLPAAVRMLLAYHGIEKQEKNLRKILKTKPAGTNPFNVTYLKDFGFEARISFSNIEELKTYLSQEKPVVILLWTGELSYWDSTKYFDYLHAVVAIGYDKVNIVVNDPAFSKHPIAIPHAEFSEAWSYSQQMFISIDKTSQ